MFVLLGLVFSGLLSRLTDPLISLGIALISDVFGFVR
jgi:hypothetical protein